MVIATFSIAFLSMAVWAHHMFTTGVVDDPFFSVMSYLIAVPTGIKIFNWIATMWKGQIRFTTAMLFCIGMLYTFTVGGISGVMAASPPLDFQFNDLYFIVAHFHNVLIGGTVFITFAGFYYWFPKMTGRFLDERLGRIHFATWLVGVPSRCYRCTSSGWTGCRAGSPTTRRPRAGATQHGGDRRRVAARGGHDPVLAGCRACPPPACHRGG